MKKLFFLSLFVTVCSLSSFAQKAKVAATTFTKNELLECKDIKALIAPTDPSKDYSKYIVRTFNLVISGNVLPGAGSVWTQEQKNAINMAKDGTSFSLKDVKLVEMGTKNPPVELSIVSFNMKD